MSHGKRRKKNKMDVSNTSGVVEIPTARYNVGVIFNAEVLGFRSHLFRNVPNTELGALLTKLRTFGCPIFADEGKREVMVMPTGILALDIKLKEDVPEALLGEVTE